MIKHEDLMQQTFVHAEGYIFAIDKRHPKFPHAICATQPVNPEYLNVLAAASLLYRTACETATYFESLVEYLEEKGLAEAVPSVLTVQATLDSAMKIAIEGYSKKSPDEQKTA